MVRRSPRVNSGLLTPAGPSVLALSLSLSLSALLGSLDEAQAVVLGVVEFAPVNAIKRQLTGVTSRFQLVAITQEWSDVNHKRRP